MDWGVFLPPVAGIRVKQLSKPPHRSRVVAALGMGCDRIGVQTPVRSAVCSRYVTKLISWADIEGSPAFFLSCECDRQQFVNFRGDLRTVTIGTCAEGQVDRQTRCRGCLI